MNKDSSSHHINDFEFKIFADYSQDWIYWLLPDGSINYMSPSCQKITGYKPEEFCKRPELITEIILPEYREKFKKHHKFLSGDCKSGQIHFPIKTINGDIKWIEHFCNPIFDNQGKKLGCRISNRDITERKLTQKRLEKQFAFEELISTISARFIKITFSEIDDEINKTLREIVEFLELGRSYIYEILNDEGRSRQTHGYVKKGVKPLPEYICNRQYPWITKEILSGNIVAGTKAEDFLKKQLQTGKVLLSTA